MKFITIALAAIILFPGAAFATEVGAERTARAERVSNWVPVNLDDLTITVVPKEKILEKECNWKKRGTLNGCFINADDHIFIRSNMDRKDYVMVFYHEIGHYYTEEFRLSELRPLFEERRETGREPAADDFAIYMVAPWLLTPEKLAFFEGLQVDRERVQALLMENWPY